jgi:hypothetical protein
MLDPPVRTVGSAEKYLQVEITRPVFGQRIMIVPMLAPQ